MQLVKVADEGEVIRKLCSLIETTAAQAISSNGKFTVGLSGGSLIKYLCQGLPGIKTDWSRWVVFFCDERLVPEDSEDSTYGTYVRDLLPNVPLFSQQFITVQQGVTSEEAAEDYRSKLLTHLGEDPRFDMLLLGMGPDGHTCSLFPGHLLLRESRLSVAAIQDSPKPPPARITLTLPVINRAHCCVFAMSGQGKAAMVKRILKDKEDLPAGMVQPTEGSLYWILDEAAAELL